MPQALHSGYSLQLLGLMRHAASTGGMMDGGVAVLRVGSARRHTVMGALSMIRSRR